MLQSHNLYFLMQVLRLSNTLLLLIIFLAPTEVAKILSFGKIGFGSITDSF